MIDLRLALSTLSTIAANRWWLNADIGELGELGLRITTIRHDRSSCTAVSRVVVIFLSGRNIIWDPRICLAQSIGGYCYCVRLRAHAPLTKVNYKSISLMGCLGAPSCREIPCKIIVRAEGVSALHSKFCDSFAPCFWAYMQESYLS